MSPFVYVGIAFIGGGLALATRPLFAEVKNPADPVMAGGFLFLLGVGCLLVFRFFKQRNP
jgi:hypothetical protein